MDTIVLEDGSAGTDTPLIPVPAPERVGRYHPALAALRTRVPLAQLEGCL